MEDLPRGRITHVESPDGSYVATLSDTDQPYKYWLTITRAGRQLVRCHFEGEISSSFWSHDGRYVAINNHCGHRSWHVWVIALRTGTIIHAAGQVKARGYDAYLDYSGFPDIYTSAKGIMQTLAPGIADYYQRFGPVSVAYGWKNGGKLLVFTEAISDTLADKEDAKVYLTNVCQVSSRGMRISNLIGEKVRMGAGYPHNIGSWFP